MDAKLKKAKEALNLYNEITKKYDLVDLSDNLEELDGEYTKKYMEVEKLIDKQFVTILLRYKDGQDVSGIIKDIFKASIIHRQKGIATEKEMKDTLKQIKEKFRLT